MTPPGAANRSMPEPPAGVSWDEGPGPWPGVPRIVASQKGAGDMTRRKVIRVVLGTALGLGLAGPTVAQIKPSVRGEKGPPLPPYAPTVVKVVAVALTGLQEVNCLDCNTLAATITKGGSYKVHVAVRNYGPGNSNANLWCTINVSGNYSTGGYPYALVLTKKIGVAIAPNNTKAVVFDLGTLDFAPNRSATYQITTSIGSL